MLNKIKSPWFFLIPIILCSCGMFRDKNLAKRYRNNSNIKTFANAKEPQLFVQVDLHSILINEAEEKDIKYNILSLTDKGQEAFINSLNIKTTTSAQLMDLLSTNFDFSKEEKSKIKIIPKTIKKVLIFTVDRLQYHYTPPPAGVSKPLITYNTLGDRISYLELAVQLPPFTHAIFNSWDKYVTDKVTLNLGKVSSAQNWNASLNLSAKGATEVSLTGSNTREDFISDKNTNTTTLVNTGSDNSNINNYELLSSGKGTGSKTNSLKGSGELGGSATVGYADSYETSLDLSSQILKLSGTLSGNKILLRQEGGPGIDLSGNIVVSVEYTITDDWAPPVEFLKFKNLYALGLPNALNSIITSFYTVIYPDIQNNITGQLNYSFLYRQVNKGNKHLPEARQKVKYRYGSVSYLENHIINNTAIDLVKTQDVRPKAYVIRLSGSISDLELNNNSIKFETVSEATTFLAYIKDLVQRGMPINTLTVNGIALTNANVPNLRVITLQL